MIGSLLGPKDTPYEGGLFYVDIGAYRWLRQRSSDLLAHLRFALACPLVRQSSMTSTPLHHLK